MAGPYVETNGTRDNSLDDQRGLLTVTQVADRLNVHPHSVRRWADSGLLACYRIGLRGDRRFRQDDVEDFLVTRPISNHA